MKNSKDCLTIDCTRSVAHRGYCGPCYNKLIGNGTLVKMTTLRLQSRKAVVIGDVAYLPLGSGGETVIDASKAYVDKYLWHLDAYGYVNGAVDGKQVKLHRYLMGLTDPKILVDHKNRNPLDNRLSNLRPCSKSQNGANMIRKPKSNKYKGVFKYGAALKYSAQIQIEGVLHRLGTFNTAVEAAKAYDKEAYKLFGEFARLNFPEEHAV